MSAAQPRLFSDFIGPDADRFAILYSMLMDGGLEPLVAELSGSRHLVVGPRGRLGRIGRRAKPRTVLLAHYDRAAGTPGANDNSAAVFQLAEAAARLRAEGKDGWLAVFTDREEAAGRDGAKGQGAYALAEGLKSLSLSGADVFIFDACGRGDTLIVSTAVDALLSEEGSGGNGRTLSAIRSLREKALRAAETSVGSRVMLAPTPFSDDAGFLAAGIAAQTVTLLPAGEAAVLTRASRNAGISSRALVSRERGGPEKEKRLQDAFPRTWSLLHTASDDAASLTFSSFPMVVRFAVALCG
ncbi:MAG TPA: hypothetical protein DIC34_20210 [Treponema sp.]|nr:MAG: hypothetical protein A2001_06495 [Treponema sp. GWC1_61_84]HCM28827.1 hypothetical protein [Treponema sp.]